MSNVTKDFYIWTKDISASTVLHSLPDAVFITDSQMRIFYFNLAAEKLTGFKSREAMGMYCKDILKSGICETECAVKRALDADKDIFNIETTIVTATGHTIPSLISALLIKDAIGNIFGYLYSFRDISALKKVMSDLEISRAELTGKNIELARTLEELNRDITKRKQAEKMLGEKSEEQTLLLDNIQTLIWYLKDVETQGIVNKACADFFGEKKEDLENKKLHDIMSSKEEAEICIAGNKEVFEKKVTIHTEEWARNAKGEKRLLAITKTPKIRENGNVEYVVCSAEDITERKQAEAVMKLRYDLMEYAGTHSLEELLQKTLDEIGALTNSPIGFYHFVEPDQKTLSLQAWSTKTEKEFCTAKGKGMHYGIDQAGVWVDCIHERRPVIHNDYISLPHRKGLPEGHAAVIRELVVPIMREDYVVAVLGIGNKPTHYTEKDAELVSFIADVAWEITEHKRVEEALRDSEVRYRFLFNGIADAVYVHEVSAEKPGKFFAVNDSACRMLGYTKDEFIRMEVKDIDVPEQSEKIASVHEKLFRDGKALFEGYHVAKDGRRIPVEINIQLFELQGKSMVLAVARDITERKQAEEAFRKSEEKFRTVADWTYDWEYWMSPEASLLYVSPSVERITGYSAEEFQREPDNCSRIVYPEDQSLWNEHQIVHFDKAANEVSELDFRILTRDGLIKWIHHICRPVFSEDGRFLGRRVSNRDITKHKQAEKMLGEKSEEQTLLLDNIQTLIWHLKDVETQGIVNKACADFFGEKKEDLENKKLHDIMSSKEEAEICIAGNKEVFEKKVTIHTEEWARNAKGEKRLLAITKTPKIRENGNVEYVVCSAEDITERKQAAEALQRAEQLKVAGDIAVGLAHELKNSLAGLEAAVEVLLAELVISDDHRSVLLRMSQEMRRVELLVKDLLNFARPARPQFTLVDINSILNNATVFSLENLSLPLEKKGTIKIVKKYDAGLPKTVADPMQLHQVFVNLLINSVESMPDGGSLTVETSYEQTRKMIQVSISDTGAGIRREYLDKIFEPFFTTKSQGTGLGLPITKRLIEQNNGDITADNNPNGGAIFKVTLPLKRLEESDRYEI